MGSPVNPPVVVTIVVERTNPQATYLEVTVGQGNRQLPAHTVMLVEGEGLQVDCQVAGFVTGADFTHKI